MRFTDKHLFYDESLSPEQQLQAIKRVLDRSKSGVELMIHGYGIAELIHRACWHFGVSPLWILVSIQRERSILGQLADSTDLMYACGVVNQDEAGTANPLWLGLATQIFMGARTAAWLAGIGPQEAFGYRKGLWPTPGRWGMTDSLLGKKIELRTPRTTVRASSASEYMQLSYTPHLDVLTTNGNILESILQVWDEKS